MSSVVQFKAEQIFPNTSVLTFSKKSSAIVSHERFGPREILSRMIFFSWPALSDFLFFPIFPWCHTEVCLEGPIEIGEIFKPAPGGDGQDGLIRGLQRFGGGVQAVFVQKSDEALPRHLPEPPHEVAGTEGADPGGIGDPELLRIMGRKPLQKRFQPLGVGCLGGKPLPALCMRYSVYLPLYP